jgi:hypothetical protein
LPGRHHCSGPVIREIAHYLSAGCISSHGAGGADFRRSSVAETPWIDRKQK